jgi:hypothetical protein
MSYAERLGRLVRSVWTQWASEQPAPKPSWLVPWEELDAGQREVDIRICQAVAAVERERAVAVITAARLVVNNAYGTEPRHTRARDGQGCRGDCIPCGIAVLARAVANLEVDGATADYHLGNAYQAALDQFLPDRSFLDNLFCALKVAAPYYQAEERVAVMAELHERITNALPALSSASRWTGRWRARLSPTTSPAQSSSCLPGAAVSDRLARARRAYIHAAAAANAEFTATMLVADRAYRAAATEARLAKTPVPAAVLEQYRRAANEARAALDRAVGRHRAEVDAAIDEARENGTYHWGIAPSTQEAAAVG